MGHESATNIHEYIENIRKQTPDETDLLGLFFTEKLVDGLLARLVPFFTHRRDDVLEPQVLARTELTHRFNKTSKWINHFPRDSFLEVLVRLDGVKVGLEQFEIDAPEIPVLVGYRLWDQVHVVFHLYYFDIGILGIEMRLHQVTKPDLRPYIHVHLALDTHELK